MATVVLAVGLGVAARTVPSGGSPGAKSALDDPRFSDGRPLTGPPGLACGVDISPLLDLPRRDGFSMTLEPVHGDGEGVVRIANDGTSNPGISYRGTQPTLVWVQGGRIVDAWVWTEGDLWESGTGAPSTRTNVTSVPQGSSFEGLADSWSTTSNDRLTSDGRAGRAAR
ncbi:MAG: hypothetical protein FWF90_17290 [Promicromonosporaceae bacterium]|nr:hypothetical protein [Promicromonosporaceae bacterium]